VHFCTVAFFIVCLIRHCEGGVRPPEAISFTVGDYFVAQYGERVLAEPQRKGFTSLVWFLPMIVALIGLWIVYEILKNWRKQKPVLIATKPLPEIPEAVLKKIERELQEMD
jgi:cytochrome c-type biogenesis protein CcmH